MRKIRWRRYLLIGLPVYFVTYSIVGYILYVMGGDQKPNTLVFLATYFLISFVIMHSLREYWIEPWKNEE